MEKCLSGEKMDAPPVSLWRHFPVDDQSPDRLASAITNFQNTFDFDFIKVTPASSFCLRDWGVEDQWKNDPEGTRAYTNKRIEKPEDWLELKTLNPRQGFLAAQLETLQLLRAEFPSHTPLMQTIFDPMSQAKNLAGQEGLLKMVRETPDALHAGLRTITLSIIEFIETCKPIGIDGFFLAIQHAQANLLSEQEFRTFCLPYDLEILKSIQDCWLNMIHIHGEGIYFDAISQLPVQIINWHDRHTDPNLRQAREKFSGVLCGGLSRLESLTLGDPDSIQQEANAAFRDSGGTRFILGTGCVVPITAPFGNILIARNSVNQE